MSKKKNTLKDLDEFLKQQAATLVAPTRLSDQLPSSNVSEPPPPPPAPPVVTAPPVAEIPRAAAPVVSAEKVLQDLRELASREGNHFRGQLYDLIIQSVETQQQLSPEDRMLINTALYLKSGERWKDVIREYWKKKN
jgi:hypothetical protein